MVVLPWYVNIHLYPPSVVTLIVSFAHSVDPLKQSKESVLRWNCCEPQFTGPVFIPIILNNHFSDQWISVFGGVCHYNFHIVHGMTDLFLSLPFKCKNCLSLQPLSVRSVECSEWLWSPALLVKPAKEIVQRFFYRPAVSLKCQSLQNTMCYRMWNPVFMEEKPRLDLKYHWNGRHF